MANLYLDVLDFHMKYKLPFAETPQLLNSELHDFRVKFLKEELKEYIDAWEDDDLVKAADALVDLVYVALGTAAFMGVPFNACWAPVQYANMNYKRRATAVDQSTRQSTFDVVKLPNFVPPDEEIKKILIAAGAKIS